MGWNGMEWNGMERMEWNGTNEWMNRWMDGRTTGKLHPIASRKGNENQVETETVMTTLRLGVNPVGSSAAFVGV